MSHEIVLLSDKINWDYCKRDFKKDYANTGQNAMQIKWMDKSMM